MKKTLQLVLLLLVISLTCQVDKTQAIDLHKASWDEIVQAADGQTVDWYMWGGFPAVNTYVNTYVAARLKEKYNITLRQVPVKDIAEVVSKLVIEKQAGKTSGGNVDLMWINGENFRTCKRHDLLFGPFADKLPNQRFVDWSKPSVYNDFGTPVEGMESPWGSAQMVMIYDTARTPEPPGSMAQLIDWIRQHPGKFAYPAPPDFTGSVFVRHVFYHYSEDVNLWQGEYTQKQFEKAASATYRLLTELKPALWRQGTTYPESPVRMNTLFADGEIDFSFSYHQAEASRNIQDGLFPPTVRSFVFDQGTIANTHFVAIPYNAADTAAAMVTANFLLSAEAQMEKAKPDVWGDFPALDITRLPRQQQQQFIDLPRGPATLSNQELQAHQLPEPPSEILIQLEKGWEQHVLKGR
ncbi:ABC transporter substrate-binding protein [Desulfogranum marinum]|uniref:ABC transporter substrate-binding protein n=1 Tax=Desulfogranum marinum TaxID=453220 RepID=UPI001964A2E4|nr:ABC transporter substrate-binding protein [Desulfogranum marinum]MBM9511811.1 ABC transporter substrate-binding protein [Desulfogranum marinum]